jgi:hypothetical protein
MKELTKQTLRETSFALAKDCDDEVFLNPKEIATLQNSTAFILRPFCRQAGSQ